MSVEVTGQKELSQAIDRIVRALKSGGALDDGVEAGAEVGADYASQIVPRDSGTLARAQTVLRYGGHVAIGISPGMASPRGGRPEVYGPIVAATVRDFYGQVVNNRGDQIVQRTMQEFVRAASQ
jgi:hypothetical protein